MRLVTLLAAALVVLLVPAASVHAAPVAHPVACALPALEVRADCLRLAVPENRDVASSRTIELFAVVLRSRAARPAPDPVVFLQGGPGEAASIEAEDLARSPLLATRDVILLDQRGTGRSRPELQCPEFAAAAPRFFAPRVTYAEGRALGRRALRACAARLRSAGVDLDGYDSEQTASDVEDLRVALGVAQINLYGVSYGTRAALVTLRAHPKGIRSVVADSGAGPEGTDTRPTRLLAGLRTGFARAFSERPGLGRAVDRLVRSYDRRPLRTRARVGGARRARPIEITGSDALVLVHLLLRSGETIPRVPRVVAALRRRDPRVVRAVAVPILEAATQPGLSILGAQLSVDCGDAGPLTAADRRLLRRPGRYATFLLLASGGFCDDWRVAPSAPADRAPVRSDAPVLLVAGELDPISPPAGLRGSGLGLPSSTFLLVPGAGHVPSREAEDVARAVVRFFADPVSTSRARRTGPRTSR